MTSLIFLTFSFKGLSSPLIFSNSEYSSYVFILNRLGISSEKKVCFIPNIISIHGDKSLCSKLFLDLIINSGNEFLYYHQLFSKIYKYDLKKRKACYQYQISLIEIIYADK